MELKERVEKIIKEWEPLKSEYALPNSTVGITDLWTVAYDMADLIKDQQARINELEAALQEIMNAVNNLNDIWDIENIAKQALSEAGE